MVNEASEGKRQERPWQRLPAMPMCKPFEKHRQRSERQTEPSENHDCFLQSFLWNSWSGIAFSGSANDQRESETCCSQTVLKKYSVGKIWWSLSVNLHCKS